MITENEGAHRRIDARSIVTLVIFLVVNILVLFPLRIPLPFVLGRIARRVRAFLLGPSEGSADEDEEEEDDAAVSVAGNGGEKPRPPIPSAGPANGHGASAEPAPGSGSSSTASTRARRSRKRPVFTLGLAVAPVAGVLLLLASTCIPGHVVRRGIVGEGRGSVRPYDVMTLFLSFAYISLSLDCTGLLLFLAFTVAMRAPPNGRALFTYLYALFVALALLVGNDPIVLSGTPFVAYFTSHARISPPRAFLFAEFQSANLASALLVSSNPTNLVLTSSFEMSFLKFSAWTALPTIAAAAALYPTLLVLFRKSIPQRIEPPHVVPLSALTDPFGAIFTTTIFITCIVALVALSAVGKLEGTEGVWTVTAPAAILVLLRDLWYDWTHRGAPHRSVLDDDDDAGDGDGGAVELSPIGPREHDIEGDANPQAACAITVSKAPSKPEALQVDNENRTTGIEVHPGPMARHRSGSTVVHARPVVMRRHGSGDSRALNIPPPPDWVDPARSGPLSRSGSDAPTAASSVSGLVPALAPLAPIPASAATLTPAHGRGTHSRRRRPAPAASVSRSKHPLAVARRTFPTVALVVARLPLLLLPFAFSMFILVEALDYVGWVHVWSDWWAAFARAGGAAGCIVLMAVISVIGCNILGTNIGVTVLLSRILVAWDAAAHPSKRALYGSILSLAVGSNFGAYSFSFPASLAGLLWRDILAHKGLHVRRLEFLRWNLVPLAVTLAVAACVVGAEVCVMFAPGQK